MLIAKKINQKKALILFSIAAVMIGGIVFFVYKNYTLTNKNNNPKTIVRLETINMNKVDSSENGNPSKARETNAAGNAAVQSAPTPEVDFFSNSKWLNLKKTNYIFPERTATGTDNPFGIK